jgi:hypothetical protein
MDVDDSTLEAELVLFCRQSGRIEREDMMFLG